MTVKPVHILFLLAIGAPLLALIPTDQDPEQTDWAKAVKKACTSRRYGLRLAAAKKVAAAGDASVGAIRAWAKEHGRNALPDSLVSAIAQQTTTGDAVVELLLEWAGDRDFFWRPKAVQGLANRATAMPERRKQLLELFEAYRDDPAWLVCVYARLGLHLLDSGNRAAGEQDDPRIGSKLTALLLDHGKAPPLQPLLDALADERTFQADPWGQRRASEAHKALRTALGEQHPMADGKASDDKIEAITAVRDAIHTRWNQELSVPELQTDPDIGATGGIAVQSCRDGDLFVQWSDDGRIYEGLDSRFVAQLPAPVWAALAKERATLALDGSYGVLICDNMRLRWHQPETHSRIAPDSMPASTAEWLGKLAIALQDADRPQLSAAMRAALDQFGSR